MNTQRRWSWLAVLAAGLVAGLAQTYKIDWYTIDGGGGTSSGGQYTVSGTIGQPDAGKMTGGNYELTGGFWGIAIVLQEPGSPPLTIMRSGGNVVLTWLASYAGFTLQTNVSAANPAGWGTAVQSVVNNNGTNTVTVPANFNLNFFRLKK
jgi:hypothetical protein